MVRNFTIVNGSPSSPGRTCPEEYGRALHHADGDGPSRPAGVKATTAQHQHRRRPARALKARRPRRLVCPDAFIRSLRTRLVPPRASLTGRAWDRVNSGLCPASAQAGPCSALRAGESAKACPHQHRHRQGVRRETSVPERRILPHGVIRSMASRLTSTKSERRGTGPVLLCTGIAKIRHPRLRLVRPSEPLARIALRAAVRHLDVVHSSCPSPIAKAIARTSSGQCGLERAGDTRPGRHGLTQAVCAFTALSRSVSTWSR